MTDLLSPRQAAVEAFLATWELFPEPVCLIDRQRNILASNALGRETGRVGGTRCFTFNRDAQGETCLGNCRANASLDGRVAMVRRDTIQGFEIASYWVPLPGLPDCYVHFGIGVKALMDAMAQGGNSGRS